MDSTSKPVANEWDELEKEIVHLASLGTPISRLRKLVEKCKDNHTELWELSQSMMASWEKLQEEQAKEKEKAKLIIASGGTMPKLPLPKGKYPRDIKYGVTPWSGL